VHGEHDRFETMLLLDFDTVAELRIALAAVISLVVAIAVTAVVVTTRRGMRRRGLG
jgi:hypothetical protein